MTTDLIIVLLGGVVVAVIIWLIDRGIAQAERNFEDY